MAPRRERQVPRAQQPILVIEGHICAFIYSNDGRKLFMPLREDWDSMCKDLATILRIRDDTIKLAAPMAGNNIAAGQNFEITAGAWPGVLRLPMVDVLTPPYQPILVSSQTVEDDKSDSSSSSGDIVMIPKKILSTQTPVAYTLSSSQRDEKKPLPQQNLNTQVCALNIDKPEGQSANKRHDRFRVGSDSESHDVLTPGMVTLNFVETSGLERRIRLRRDHRLKDVRQHFAVSYNICPEELTLSFDGRRIAEAETPQSLGMEDGDIVYLILVQKGGKPVIYLYPPGTCDVSVKLSLCPQWSFSAIYPPTIVSGTGDDRMQRKELVEWESVTWDVRASPDGLLVDETGLEASYLYWEAKSKVSEAQTPHDDEAAFNPHSPASCLLDSNSVLLPVNKVTAYLDGALKSLGLHTEGRTSFITYWLPSFLDHDYLALRFLPQSIYTPTCPVEITPKPDIVTRIFLLFRGINFDDLGLWPDAVKRGSGGDFGQLREQVGVDSTVRQMDLGLFRVLEWGGMEIK